MKEYQKKYRKTKKLNKNAQEIFINRNHNYL